MSGPGDKGNLLDAASRPDSVEDSDFGTRIDTVSSRIYGLMLSVLEPEVRLQDLGSRVTASSGSRDGFIREDAEIGDRDTWEYTVVWDRSLDPVEEGPTIWVVIELERPYGEEWDGEITNVTRIEVSGRGGASGGYHLRAVCPRSGPYRTKYADRPGADEGLHIVGSEGGQDEVDTIVEEMETRVEQYVRQFSGAEL